MGPRVEVINVVATKGIFDDFFNFRGTDPQPTDSWGLFFWKAIQVSFFIFTRVAFVMMASSVLFNLATDVFLEAYFNKVDERSTTESPFLTSFFNLFDSMNPYPSEPRHCSVLC